MFSWWTLTTKLSNPRATVKKNRIKHSQLLQMSHGNIAKMGDFKGCIKMYKFYELLDALNLIASQAHLPAIQTYSY